MHWKAADMAAHVKKWEEFQQACEIDWEAKLQVVEAAKAASRTAFRDSRRRRFQECVQFKNEWLEEGYEKWRKNLAVAKDRKTKEVALARFFESRKQQARRRVREAQEKDAESGVEWFEAHMQRLGLSFDKEATMADSDYFERAKAKVGSMTSDAAAVRTMVANLKKKGEQTRAAKLEREQRRERLMLEQERAKAALEKQTKLAKLSTMCAHLDKAILRVGVTTWRFKCAKAKKAADRNERVAALQRKFEEDCAESLVAFSREVEANSDKYEAENAVIQSKIHEMKKIARERKTVKSTAVCRETIDKLLDLTCCVLREREVAADKLMTPATWRTIKARFVSRDAFFSKRWTTVVTKGADPLADAAALAEINALTTGEEDPVVECASILQAVAAQPSFRSPDYVDSNNGVVRMVVVASSIAAAEAAANLQTGVDLVTINAAIRRALELADSEDASEGLLREKGLALRALGEEAYPDGLVVETLVAYIGELDTGWILAGFPQTCIQAKLLENAMCGYVDPEVEEALGTSSSKKKKSKQVVEVQPSCFDVVLFVADNQEELESWWSTRSANTCRCSPSVTPECLEETIDVLVDVSRMRQRRQCLDLERDRDKAGAVAAVAMAALQDDSIDVVCDFKLGAPPQTVNDDLIALLAARVSRLTPAQRLWRSHVVGENELDLGRLNTSVETWRNEAESHCGILDSFAYGLGEQAEALRDAVSAARRDFYTERDDNRWADIRDEAQRAIQDTGLSAISDMETAMIEVADDRRESALRLIEELVGAANATLVDATTHMSVLAVILIAAEVSRFLEGLELIGEYARIVGGEQLAVPDQDVLRVMCDALTDDAAHCSSEVAEKIEAATRLAPARPTAQVFVRRLHGMVCRLRQFDGDVHALTHRLHSELAVRSLYSRDDRASAGASLLATRD